MKHFKTDKRDRLTLPADNRQMSRTLNTPQDAASDDGEHQSARVLFMLGGDLMRKKAEEAARPG